MLRIAVAVPAFNEAARVVACVRSLLEQSGPEAATVVVMANNCTDTTAERLTERFGSHPQVDLREVSLPPPLNHVGWARRLAMDAAADQLREPSDVLLTTDADTVVAPDWLAANLRHLDAGCDAVAGAAHLMRHERATLEPPHRARLLRAGKYLAALAYLRAADAPPHDRWPRHDYEGGASIALRLGLYRAIGGSPVLQTGEDRALFDAVRTNGGRVRHATDVRVFTSCRLSGRAHGGTADTLEHWGGLGLHEPAHGLPCLSAALQPDDQGVSGGERLSFADLPYELGRARTLVRQRRRLALSLVG